MKHVALIVTYNRLNKLKLCVQATRDLNFDLIVIIDNASSDHTQEWLSSLTDPRLKIIRTPINLGGAGGFKYGAHYISNLPNIEWIFFFDDDAYPSSDLLNNFNILNKGQYKLFCSKVLTPDHKICRMNTPYKAIPRTLLQNIHYYLQPHLFLPHPNEACLVKSFSFVGAIIHHDILKQYHDVIDANLFIYFDDLYFSYFLTQKHYKILYVPSLVFIHDTQTTSNILSNQKLYYLTRNLIISYKIFKKPPFTIPTISARILRLLGMCFIKSRHLKGFYYFYQGIKDAFFYQQNTKL